MNENENKNKNIVVLDNYVSDAFHSFFKNNSERSVFTLACKRAFLKADSQAINQPELFLKALEMKKIGLDIMPEAGHLYVVPYKENVTITPTVLGLGILIKQSGYKCTSSLVYSNDSFKFIASEDRFEHSYGFEDRGEFKGVYCVLTSLSDGHQLAEYVSSDEVEKIKNNAPSSKPTFKNPTPIWVKYFGEMARKVAIKRCVKRSGILSPQLQEAIRLDNEPFIDMEEKATNIACVDPVN